MRTNRLIFLIVIFVFVFNYSKTKAQDWAPIGATWHYTMSYEYPLYLSSFIKIVSEKDTVINSVNCRKLIEYKAAPDGTPNYYKFNLYMYESSRKVYYYVDSLNRFCLLYDFNANTGDWWILDEYPTSWEDTVKVLSTSTITINGQQRKTMNTHLTSNNGIIGFDGLAIEGIGNATFMFPTFDMNSNGPLRCYQDNILGIYTTGITPTCETTTIGIEEIINNDKVTIFPNPFTDYFEVKLNNEADYKIEIISALNQTVYCCTTKGEITIIPTKQLVSGLYLIKILTSDNQIITKTIIKE